ncbi:UNVERIFIED_CONTAM: hypothetical protein FKN15_067615 [Acipenser sinensis]
MSYSASEQSESVSAVKPVCLIVVCGRGNEPVSAAPLHLVSESVGAPTTLKMDFKDLIAMINWNTTAQQEQNKKWRVELGLPEPEPTELDRLLQKWEVELLSREPEEEELPLPEPRGEELPLPEPRGEELPLPEPRGEEPLLQEPRGEEPPLPESRGEKLPLPEHRGEEPKSIPPPLPRPPPLQSSLALMDFTGTLFLFEKNFLFEKLNTSPFFSIKMASVGATSAGKSRRIPLISNVCLKNQDRLSQHLLNVCMKQSSKEEVDRVVDTARNSMINHLWNGRLLEFSSLMSIVHDPHVLVQLVAKLEETGHIIKNKKEFEVATSNEVSQPNEQAEPAEQDDDMESDEEVEEMEPLYQPPDYSTWSTKLRKLMHDSGFYRKHPLDSELLAGFTKYLREDRGIPNCKQEVASVSRIMYHMNHSMPCLEFVRDMAKTRSYFVKLIELGQTKQTVANYLKNLKRFIKYITVATSLIHKDRQLHEDCKHYLVCLSELQKDLNKQVSQEITRKMFTQMVVKTPSPAECLAILLVAKKDFLEIIDKAAIETALDEQEYLTVLYYLEAVLMLRHLQRPGVVKNMTVQEWCIRQKFSHGSNTSFIIGVKNHKTATQQVATISLNKEEERYRFVRSTFLKKPDLKTISKSDKDTFFISTSGSAIYNPSTDLHRFHDKYKLPSITSQFARRIFETSIKTGFTDAEKGLVADYLAHTTATAEKHYRLKTSETAVKGMELLRRIGSPSVSYEEASCSGGVPLPQPTRAIAAAAYVNQQIEEGKLLQIFLEAFPVFLEGEPPKKKDRERHFPCRQPSVSQIERYINRQEWKKNTIKADDVERAWWPASSTTSNPSLKLDNILKLIKTQVWKGLHIQQNSDKGKLVTTTRKFAKGELVCDYHGIPRSHKEGLQLLQDSAKDEMGYLFFYTNTTGQKCCMDARTVPCPCHPELDTFG